MNKLQDIQGQILKGESDTLELKKSTSQLREVAKTLCAFLNNNGGKVLIGVTPEGKIVGQDVSDKTKREIYEIISKIEPSTDVMVDYMKVSSSKTLIIFTANSQEKHKPYVFDSVPYQRIESSTRKMPQRMQEQMYLKRSGYFDNWEKMVSSIQAIDTLNFETINNAIINSGLKVPKASKEEKIKMALRHFDLMDSDDKLINAAHVLFGKNLGRDYAQCLIKLAVFKGTDKLGGFIENKQYYVNSFAALDIAEKFFEMFLPKSGTFVEGSFRRKDEYPIPIEAFREAMINALCHRDYSDRAGSVSVAIYNDRLEVSNIGELPARLTLKDLEHEHPSLPRNKIIASVFKACGYFEKWGTGTLKIIDLCKKHGCPKPIFKEQAGAFYVIFKFNKNIGGVVENIKTSFPEGLNKTQKEILTLIKSIGGQITTAELIQELGLSKRTIQRHLQDLRNIGLLQQVGKAQKAKWIL